MELMLFGLGFFVLIIFWEKIWTKVVLGRARDSLFDLRDNAREWFLKNDYSLDHKSYQGLVQLLNVQLRYLDSTSLLTSITICDILEKDKDLAEEVRKQIQTPFEGADAKVQAYTTTVRENASFVVTIYQIFRSMPITFLMILAILVALPIYSLKKLYLVFCTKIEIFLLSPRILVEKAAVCLFSLLMLVGGAPQKTLRHSNTQNEVYAYASQVLSK